MFPKKCNEIPLSRIGRMIIKNTPKRPVIPPRRNFEEIFSLRKNLEKKSVRIGIEEAIIAAFTALVRLSPV